MDPSCDPEVRHGGRCRLTMFTKQVFGPGRSQIAVPEIAGQEPNPSFRTPQGRGADNPRGGGDSRSLEPATKSGTPKAPENRVRRRDSLRGLTSDGRESDLSREVEHHLSAVAQHLRRSNIAKTKLGGSLFRVISHPAKMFRLCPTRPERHFRNLAALLAALTLGSAQWATPSRVPLMPRTSRWRR